jgi:uncharacterized protein (TIGR03437 family)
MFRPAQRIRVVAFVLALTPKPLSAQPTPSAPSLSRTGSPVPRQLPPGASAAYSVSPDLTLPALSATEIAQRRKAGRAVVGQPRPTGGLPAGAWKRVAGGASVWTAVIQVTGAAGIRLHFSRFAVGRGKVWIHAGDPAAGQLFGPWSGSGPNGTGDFWTEMVFGQTLYLEYLAEAGRGEQKPPFDAPELFHLWEPLTRGQAVRPATSSNYSCFLDESCYTVNANVVQLSQAVAYLLFPNTGESCTGTLLNDLNSTGTPYLITAGHCVTSALDAQAMLAFFDYRTSACNGPIPNFQSFPQVAGSTLLSRSLGSSDDLPDFAFVLLPRFPPVNVTSMGWSAAPAPGARMTSLSHPRNLPQVLAAGSIVGEENPLFYMVTMFQGAVDHGSSGSGILTDANQLVGVLHGGPTTEDISICDVADRTFTYTEFGQIYPFISSWLTAPGVKPAPAAVLSTGGLGFGNQTLGTTSGYFTVSLTNKGNAALTVSSIGFTGANPGDFIQTNTCPASLPANAACAINVYFHPTAIGARAATLSVVDNAIGSPHTVLLQGAGANPVPPTLGTRLTTSINVLANNGACRVPSSITSFSTTDTAAWLYFDANGTHASDSFKVSFYRPDGALYSAATYPVASDGYHCFSSPLNIAGTAAAQYTGNWTAAAYWNQSSTAFFTLSFSVISPSTSPVKVNPGGAVSLGSYALRVAPGSLMSIFGSNMASGVINATSLPLQTSAGGTSVTMNGILCPLLYVSPFLLNVQVPTNLTVGTASVVVTYNGNSGSTTVPVTLASPALFQPASSNLVIAQHSDGTFVTAASPAKAGETIGIYGTGIGPVNPAVLSGHAPPSPPSLSTSTLPYSATVAGLNAPVSYVGLTSGLVGLMQCNIQIPLTAPAGTLPVVITIDGVPSQTAFIPVAPLR